MTIERLSEKAAAYLNRLCVEIPTRRVGSDGNHAATDFFAATLASFGFETQRPDFDCIDWTQDGATLTVDGDSIEVLVSPYSLGGRASAALMVASTVEELVSADASGKILLLCGDIAKEQLMPKDFPFYNPEEHQRIVRLLETKQPQAIVAATSQDPQLAGALCPFPLIEDGDFDIPSVYMTDDEGSRLAKHAGKQVSLDIRAYRTPARGCNVVGRRGARPDRRAVVTAHIDAKDGTPGALDDGGGTVVLLLLAELLADYVGRLGIEIVAMNGEDYYSAPGEKRFVSDNAGRFDEIVLGINLDGVGYCEGSTAYSLYDCPPDIAAAIRQTFSAHGELIEGEPWFQGDHALFVLNQRPALALAPERFMDLLHTVAHTPKDSPEIVDTAKLVEIACALHDLLLRLDQLVG